MGSALSHEQKEAIAKVNKSLKLISAPYDDSLYAKYDDLPESYKTYIKDRVRYMIEEQNVDITSVRRIKTGLIYKFPIRYYIGDKEYTKKDAFSMNIVRPVVEVVKEMLEEKGVDRKFIIIPSEEIPDGIFTVTFMLTVLFVVPPSDSESSTVSQIVGREPALIRHPESCVEYVKKSVRKLVEKRLKTTDITKSIYIQIPKFITLPRYYTGLMDENEKYGFNTRAVVREIVKEMLVAKGVDRKFVVRTGETTTTVSFVCNMPIESVTETATI
jgi:hypothetical protein